MHRWVFRALIGTLLVLAGGGGAFPAPALAQATPVADSEYQYTPVVASVFSPPRWFKGDDGQVHLVYEVMLTNAFPVAVTLDQVEVLDAGTGEVIATLAAADVTAAMSLLTAGGTPTNALAPSTVGMLWLDLAFADSAALPATIEHRLTVAVPPGLPVPTTIIDTTAAATVDRRPPVVLGAPLAGDQWAAVGSCCDGPHRRSVQAINGALYLSQRFAIDFNRLTPDDRFSDGDMALNTSFPTYGAPVLAVADAVVVAAVDQYEDQVAGQTVGITLDNADGNHVVLDLGDGRFAFYAHLKPGSVAVTVGDSVTRGQVIGAAGNSGSSDGPHLHFHLMDGPSVLAADGMPYVFAAFDLTGVMPPLAETLTYYVNAEPVPLDTSTAGPRQDELPLSGAVVVFPELETP